MDFKTKNSNRKSAMAEANPKAAREARRRRRIYGGMFGLSPNHIFNELAVGTTHQHLTRRESK